MRKFLRPTDELQTVRFTYLVSKEGNRFDDGCFQERVKGFFFSRGKRGKISFSARPAFLAFFSPREIPIRFFSHDTDFVDRENLSKTCIFISYV